MTDVLFVRDYDNGLMWAVRLSDLAVRRKSGGAWEPVTEPAERAMFTKQLSLILQHALRSSSLSLAPDCGSFGSGGSGPNFRK